MLRFNRASAAYIAVAMVSGGLGCSSQSAKSGNEGAQARSSADPSPADAPASPAAATQPPDGNDQAKVAQAPQALPGGKSDISVKDPSVIAAANFACTAEQDALKAQGKPQAISLVEVIAAQSQVVAGVSYSLTLHVKVDSHDRIAEAVVWSRPWLTGDDKIRLTSWKLVDKE